MDHSFSDSLLSTTTFATWNPISSPSSFATGVTRDVKPVYVPELTRSLLEGAHREFPGQELVATVFAPDGERIGRAHLGSDGRVRWER
jgi:hypothetical protein